MTGAPPLTVVLPVRDGWDELGPVLAALVGQARATGSEVLAVGPVADPGIDGVRTVRVEDLDIYRLRMVGVQEARGEVVAIGEDHAVPRPDWCRAVIRAHAEQPGAGAIVGCLSNATDATWAGRANFLAFAALCAPPRPDLRRPPPVSAVSLRRERAAESLERPGHLESVLLPRMFEAGEMVVDERIVVDHHQDHGARWAITNAFHSARASYGYAAPERRGDRLRVARWSLLNWPRLMLAEAGRLSPRSRAALGDLALVAVIASVAGLGGAAGSLAGPGRSPRIVA